MAGATTRAPRAQSERPELLPAAQARMAIYELPLIPTKAFLHWTFGRDTVIWRIWPAVALHTIFAAVVVSLSLKTNFQLDIPPVLLTVLGVVIGFVISYRAMSGYDRYWMGRIAWSDIIKNSRTLSRLIWFHVPLRTKAASPTDAPDTNAAEIAKQVMAEKRIALDLIEAFAVATKHHLRGERGVYYEDLYSLVQPLHQRPHHKHSRKHVNRQVQEEGNGHQDEPSHRELAIDTHHAAINVTVASPQSVRAPPLQDLARLPDTTQSASGRASPNSSHNGDPYIPAINSYGTFDPNKPHRLAPPLRHASSSSSISSCSSNGPQELRPAQADTGDRSASLSNVQSDLIPFVAFWKFVHWAITWPFRLGQPAGWKKKARRDPESGPQAEDGQTEERPLLQDTDEHTDEEEDEDYAGENGGVQRRWGRADMQESGVRRRPRYAGGGENVPLEILRALSAWIAVLEERGSVPGTSLGSMVGIISSYEDSLSTLERILTTPLPFVYSVHIRHTVWIYLAFLPFQLISQFKWYTIPGVAMAAFIYLGFVAAGEEIEQPFGYDENDLDLDMFCRDVVHVDLEHLRRTSAHNAFIGQQSTTPPADPKAAAAWAIQDVFAKIVTAR